MRNGNKSRVRYVKDQILKLAFHFEDDTFFREFHWDIKTGYKEISLRIWTGLGNRKINEECQEEEEGTKKNCIHYTLTLVRKADGSLVTTGSVVIKTITDFNRPKWHEETSGVRRPSTINCFIFYHHSPIPLPLSFTFSLSPHFYCIQKYASLASVDPYYVVEYWRKFLCAIHLEWSKGKHILSIQSIWKFSFHHTKKYVNFAVCLRPSLELFESLTCFQLCWKYVFLSRTKEEGKSSKI